MCEVQAFRALSRFAYINFRHIYNSPFLYAGQGGTGRTPPPSHKKAITEGGLRATMVERGGVLPISEDGSYF